MANPLYPENTFEERWALPVEAPQFQTAVQEPVSQPQPTYSLTPVDYDPWEVAARRTRESVRPTEGRKEGGFTRFPIEDTFNVLNSQLKPLVSKVASGIGRQLANTPQEAFEASEAMRQGYGYDPGPIVNASSMVLGAAAPFAFTVGKGVLGSAGGRLIQNEAKMTENAPRFYSAVEHAVENGQPKATAEQWLGTIQNAKGVKPDELNWIGLNDFLNENKGKVLTKNEVNDFIQQNKVELKEVQKFNITPEMEKKLETKFEAENPKSNYAHEALWYDARNKFVNDELKGIQLPKYKDYQLPGGENYREMLLTLPSEAKIKHAKRTEEVFTKREKIQDEFDALHGKDDLESLKTRKILTGEFNALTKELQELNLNREGKDFGEYTSSHWSEPNVLAHTRVNDRLIDGKKSLHVEEIQSDWHQAGRDKGYKDPKMEAKRTELKQERERLLNTYGKDAFDQSALDRFPNDPIAAKAFKDYWNAKETIWDSNAHSVPDAPFKKTWHELALKRLIREAAEKGYERLSWTPGEAQAARYDLSKQVDSIRWEPSITAKDNVLVKLDPKNGKTISLQVDKSGKIIESFPRSQTGQFEGKTLSDVIGKEHAEKILAKENGFMKDADLKIGGEGMKGFYDNIIPKAVEKLGKEWGVKVQKGEIETTSPRAPLRDKKVEPIHYIDIPSAMRESVLRKGQALFSSGFPYTFTPVDYDPFAVDQKTDNK